MYVLVTTPTGKVGSEVVRLLREKGIKHRIGARTVEKAQKEFPDSEIVRFDYQDESTLKAALQGVDAVYLASPGAAPAEPEKRLVDLAKAGGVKRIVKLSAMGVDQNDAAPLRQVEKYIEASGLEWTHVRPSFFMQNYSVAQAQSIRDGSFAEPADNARTPFIDARDIAEVAVKALTEDGHNGKAYALTGPELLSRAQVAEKISQGIGKPVKYVPITDQQFREAMKAYMPPPVLELMSALYAGVRAGWTEVKTDTVQQVLGRPPRSFEEFVKDSRSAWS
ncbi:MAG TPA: SDR family oxidoreductase [Myxococcaceae bacterium]|nr:SDR family oxidoreductase [Myxococcaceae bacterium]